VAKHVRFRPGLRAASAALLACLVFVPAAAAQPGDLDTTFSGDGRATADFGARGDFVAAVAVQADGKIVVAGTSAWDTRDPKFALARFNPDGTLDATFSGDGKVTTNFTPREDGVYGVAIQPDGKIVAAGDAGLLSGNSRFAVARYNSDGTLDTTFGGDGKVTTEVTARDDPVAGLAIQADGKIVLSGGAGANGSNPRIALARYNPDGTLDVSFSGDGKVITNVAPGREYANAVAVQADGSIVAAGLANQPGTRMGFVLVRYTIDGSLDPSFSGDGKLTTNFTPWHDSVQNLAIQPDGNIVAAGIARSGSNARFALARYTTSGALDTGFSGDGKLTTDFTSGFDGGWDVGLQADGKIVVAGEAAGSGGRFAVARYATDGTLDATFGGGGKATANFTTRADFAYGLAVQADGNLVLAGGAGWGLANPKIALARFLGS
jgi:uncharacterized delta-60 repeat protein